MVVLVVVLGFESTVLALSYRLWKLRQEERLGSCGDIPAVGEYGWRHGVMPLSRRRPFYQRALVARIAKGVESISSAPVAVANSCFICDLTEIVVVELR